MASACKGSCRQCGSHPPAASPAASFAAHFPSPHPPPPPLPSPSPPPLPLPSPSPPDARAGDKIAAIARGHTRTDPGDEGDDDDDDDDDDGDDDEEAAKGDAAAAAAHDASKVNLKSSWSKMSRQHADAQVKGEGDAAQRQPHVDASTINGNGNGPPDGWAPPYGPSMRKHQSRAMEHHASVHSHVSDMQLFTEVSLIGMAALCVLGCIVASRSWASAARKEQAMTTPRVARPRSSVV